MTWCHLDPIRCHSMCLPCLVLFSVRVYLLVETVFWPKVEKTHLFLTFSYVLKSRRTCFLNEFSHLTPSQASRAAVLKPEHLSESPGDRRGPHLQSFWISGSAVEPLTLQFLVRSQVLLLVWGPVFENHCSRAPGTAWKHRLKTVALEDALPSRSVTNDFCQGPSYFYIHV